MTDFLFYAEDPGAANYVGPLSGQLRDRGYAVTLLAQGSAAESLSASSIAWTPAPAGADFDRAVGAMAPRVIVSGTSENPDSAGLRLIDYARTHGSISVGAVDAFPNAPHRFRGRETAALAHAPHYLMVPDAPTRDAYAALGFPAERIHVCGHPQFDTVLCERRRFEETGRDALRRRHFGDLPAGRRIVLFAAEISTGFDPAQYRRSEDYSLRGWGSATGRTEIVLEEFLTAAAALTPRPMLVLRLHPKNTLDELALYTPHFDLISRGGSPLELVFAADAVAGMTSMLLMEAVLLGRPTLAIVPREVEKGWLPAIASGLAACATTSAEIAAWLQPLATAEATVTPADAQPLLPVEFGSRAAPFLTSLL